MNRKQKKQKRLRATYHTKTQAVKQVTPFEQQYIQHRDDYYKIWNDELLETDNESKAFIFKIKIATLIVLIVLSILLFKYFW